jgi:hypothetical protein
VAKARVGYCETGDELGLGHRWPKVADLAAWRLNHPIPTEIRGAGRPESCPICPQVQTSENPTSRLDINQGWIGSKAACFIHWVYGPVVFVS